MRIYGLSKYQHCEVHLCDIRYKVRRISEITSTEMSTNQVIGSDIDWNVNEMLRIRQ